MPAHLRSTLSRKLRALEKMLVRAASRRNVSFGVKTNTAPAAVRTAIARCGVAEVDITPSDLIAMAGYSLAGKIAKGVRNPLFARALYLDDGAGNRAALCFLDLWCASRYLLYKAALYTSTGPSGIDAAHLLLAGTHTHAGPGRYFGNTLYDTIVSNDLTGFDAAVADGLAERIAQCVNQAAQSAVPARLGVASSSVWGVSRNRAYPAFLENKEASSWNVNGPGQGAPEDLPNVSHYAIDPRVFCLAAVAEDTNMLLGAFATFSCHATALGPDNDQYDPDWPGVACNLAAQELAGQSGSRPVVALADSAGADITPMQCDGEHGSDLVQRVGEAVGSTIVQAARQAAQNAAEFTVETHFTELSPSLESTDFGCLETPLNSSRRPWAVGAPAVGGATDGHSSLYPVAVGDSMISDVFFDHKDPQFPKSLGFGLIQDFLRAFFRLAPADFVPIHTLKVAGHQFATYPGEPTITTAYRLETALKASTGAGSASIIGYAGDYSGYYPTHEEYMLQRYEGASMIRGRQASQEISDALVNLAVSQSIFTLPNRVKFSRFVPGKP
jgi:neutral ceramidase